MTLSRRESLALIAGAALSRAATPGDAPAQAGGAAFAHGVASGDPDHRSVVLWTRLTTAAESTPVRWRLAADPEMRAVAAADRDRTVKVVADGLEPGATYCYRFAADGAQSRIGRAGVLPRGRVDQLGLALASCSNYAFGHFNAYGAMSKDPAIDFYAVS